MTGEEPKVDLIDHLLNIIFVPLFIGTLILFDLVQRLGAIFGPEVHFKTLLGLHLSLRGLLRIIGGSVSVSGMENIPVTGPLIIVSNHQSLLDIPLLHLVFKAHRPRFVSKKELARWIPSVSFNLRYGQSAVIDRDNPRQAIPELKRAALRMKEQDFSLVIFPEGTRARNGEIKEFLAAGLTVLIKELPETLIVPVVIDGSWKFSYRPLGPAPRGTNIKISILPAVSSTNRHPKELVAALHQQISAELNQLRQL
jgi:1-acyl-sn-glycerol-3-phosphate acyltransferase